MVVKGINDGRRCRMRGGNWIVASVGVVLDKVRGREERLVWAVEGRRMVAGGMSIRVAGAAVAGPLRGQYCLAPDRGQRNNIRRRSLHGLSPGLSRAERHPDLHREGPWTTHMSQRCRAGSPASHAHPDCPS